MSDRSSLRRHRVQLGLTQAELAALAGVSRQLLAAAEAGANTPAVDAALRLAHALGCSAEDLFGADPASHGGAAASGVTAQATASTLVVAGCDPALAVAEAMLATPRPPGLLALDATTGTALGALHDGGVHAAVVHGRAGHLPSPPVEVVRLQLARWQVGLGLAAGLQPRTLGACLEQNVSIVQRQESAASQQALRRATRALGLELPSGAVASGHAAAARAAAVLGCAGITTEGAALTSGLRFVPLELHTVEIWLARGYAQHPGLEALGNLLSGSAFATEVAGIGGYDLTGCGTVLPATASAAPATAPG